MEDWREEKLVMQIISGCTNHVKWMVVGVAYDGVKQSKLVSLRTDDHKGQCWYGEVDERSLGDINRKR